MFCSIYVLFLNEPGSRCSDRKWLTSDRIGKFSFVRV